jgi:hypothetical protein
VWSLPTLQHALACTIPPSANSSAYTRRRTSCSREARGCIRTETQNTFPILSQEIHSWISDNNRLLMRY